MHWWYINRITKNKRVSQIKKMEIYRDIYTTSSALNASELGFFGRWPFEIHWNKREVVFCGVVYMILAS